MTVFVFLAGATGTGLVAANLALLTPKRFRACRAVGHGRFGWRRHAGSNRLLLRYGVVLAIDRLGGCGLSRSAGRFGVLIIQVLGAFKTGFTCLFADLRTNLAAREHGHGLAFQATQHFGEHPECFTLVFILWILLSIATQVDPLA